MQDEEQREHLGHGRDAEVDQVLFTDAEVEAESTLVGQTKEKQNRCRRYDIRKILQHVPGTLNFSEGCNLLDAIHLTDGMCSETEPRRARWKPSRLEWSPVIFLQPVDSAYGARCFCVRQYLLVC